MFRVYFWWNTRSGTTHKDFENLGKCYDAIARKFSNPSLAYATIEGLDLAYFETVKRD